MLSTIRSRTLLLGLLLAPAVPMAAQTNHPHLGGRGIYDASSEEAGLGLQFSGPIARRLEFYPSVDYFFADVGKRWTANIDLKYRVPAAQRPVWFYLGGGFAFNSRTIAGNNTVKSGVNVFAGIEPLRGSVHPFAELRFTSATRVRTALAAGINITLGEDR